MFKNISSTQNIDLWYRKVQFEIKLSSRNPTSYMKRPRSSQTKRRETRKCKFSKKKVSHNKTSKRFSASRLLHDYIFIFVRWLDAIASDRKSRENSENYNCLITRLFKELKSKSQWWQNVSAANCGEPRRRLFKFTIDGVTKSNKRDRSLKDIEMFVDMCACMYLYVCVWKRWHS